MTDAPPPGPAGTWCPVCSLYWNVRGCVPGKCATDASELESDINAILAGRDDVPVSPRAVAIVGAAPEMEALLREKDATCAYADATASPPDNRSCGTCWNCRVRALLARIDAAKKART